MLRSGPFDPGSQPIAQTVTPELDGTWHVGEGFALFEAEFERAGQDLLIQDMSGDILRLPGYFLGDTPTEVISENGASLSGRVVERLAGPLFPGQYAQAAGVDLSEAIGQVETLSGPAFAQRTDGSVVELEIGTKVFQGDIVRTEGGGTLGLTFLDGTIFTLAPGSRMVLDELIYDPQSAENSGVFDLVQGGFVFIAGEVAGTGGIEINTPAATMGIRGTTVLIDIQTTNGISTVTVSLNPDPDGGTGAIELFDLSGNLISTITTTDTKWIISPPFTNEPPIEVTRTPSDLNDDATLLSQAVAAFQTAITRVTNGENFVELPTAEPEPDEPVDESEGAEPTPEIETLPPEPLDDSENGPEDGESGNDNQDLDGTDEAVPEGQAAPPTEDEAQVEPTTGGTDTAQTSVNGAPEIASAPIQSIEDTPFTGTIPVTDREGDAVELTLTRGAENGQVVLATDGTFTYTPDADFEGNDTFVVTAEDSQGAITESEITVAVNPVNDAPVVSIAVAEASAQEAGLTAGPEGGQATGQITYADVDEAETPGTWSIAPSDENTTTLGTASIDPVSGEWDYNLDQSAADVLAQGQNVVETFLATVTDAEGASDTTEVRVTVTGDNDGPIVTSGSDQAVASMSEAMTGFNTSSPDDPSDPSATGSVSGTLSFSDVDQGTSPGQWTIAANPANQTELGTIAIDQTSGVWTYTLDESAADVLGNGDVVTETFEAVVTDGFGASASQTVSVTVTGLNDAPTIEFSIEDVEATVTEGGFEPSDTGVVLPSLMAAMVLEEADATGTLRYVDPDGQASDVATWAVAPDGPSLGMMSIDATSGEWHYFLDQNAAQSLREGEEVIETFTATVTDGLGAASTQTITITVIGSNDASEIVVSAQDLMGDVAEGGQSTASGTLTYVDPEAQPGEVSTWSIAPNGSSLGVMTITSDTGEWLYTLDQDQADVVAQGEQVDELFTATLTDPFGATSTQIITITVTGENDAPVISATQTSGVVTEAGADQPGVPNATGTLIAVDPDQNQTGSFWTILPDAANATALGGMQIDAQTGTWTYVLNQSAAQSMNEGDSVTEIFNATITDAFGASDTRAVEITINGTNDAPTVTSGTAAVFEGDTSVSVDLSALASDVDSDGALSFATTAGPSGGGSARIVGSNLIFEPGSDFDDLPAGDTRAVEVGFTATDVDGASTSGTVTVTVTGINSRPEFSLNAQGALDEDEGSLTLNLAGFGSDPDSDESGSDLTYELLGDPSSGSARIVGNALIFETDGDFSNLGEGEEAHVVLSIRATDPGGLSITGSVQITVTGTNGAPTLAGSSLTVGADGPSASINLITLGDDPDEGEDGSTLTYTISSPPVAGTAVIVNKVLTFTPDGSFDDLGDEETSVLSIGITATDADGLTASSTITVTVTGNNNGPVITSLASDAAGDVTEAGEAAAGISSASGTLIYSDVDEATPNEGVWTVSPDTSPLGAMSIGSGTGVWTYTLDNAAAETLNEGETRSETFTATVTDIAGATANQTITVTITGTNDAPILASSTGEADVGGDNATFDLNALASDVDSADTAATLSFSIARAPSGGSLTLNGASLEFATGSDFDDLADQETQVVTFDIAVMDSSGSSSVATFSVTVTGTQTVPVITSTTADATGDVIEPDTSGTDQPAVTTGGTLTYDDPDATTPTSGIWTVEGTATLGTIEIDPTTGVWLYTLDTALADGLNEGETRSESFTATITDEDGLTDTQAITVGITGNNDAPVLSAATTPILEDGPSETVNLRDLAFDPDTGDTPATLSFSLSDGPGEGAAVVSGGNLQFFTNGDFEDLAPGETRSVSVDVEVEDTNGANSITTFQFDVTGTNDAPVIDVANSTLIGATQEAGVGFTGNGSAPDATGTLAYDDVDERAGALGSWSITPIAPSLGTLNVDANTGDWAYFLDETAADALREGATVNDTYTAVITDSEGATDSQTITITITGTNDAPVIDAVTSVTEAGYDESDPAILTGQLVADDPDTFATAPVWQMNEDTLEGGDDYGLMSINASTGLWTYVADVSAVAALTSGEMAFDNYVATVTDEFGETSSVDVTIALTGSNTAPTIFGYFTETDLEVLEAGDGVSGNATASGQLEFDDPDGGSTIGTWTIDPDGATTYGSASINASTGVWNYVLDPAKSDVLNDGQTVIETFQAQYADIFLAESNLLDLQVTITGSNDAPTLTVQTISTDEDTSVTLALRDFSADVDMEHDLTDLSFAITAPVGQGSASIDTNGVLTFDPLNDFNDLSVGDSTQVVINLEVSDPDLASTTSSVTITVNGANDAPVQTGTTTGIETIDFDSGANAVTTSSGSINDGTYTQGDFTGVWSMNRFGLNADFDFLPGTASVPLLDLDGFSGNEFGVLDSAAIDNQDFREAEIIFTPTSGGPFSVTGFDLINDDGLEGETGEVVVEADQGDLTIAATKQDDGGAVWSLLITNDSTETTILDTDTASYQDVLDALVDIDTLGIFTRSTDNVAFPPSGTGLGNGIGIDNIVISSSTAPALDDLELTEFAGTIGSTVDQTGNDVITFTDADLTDVGHTTTISSATTSGATIGAPANAALLGYLNIVTTKASGSTNGAINWTFTAEDQDFDYLAAGETLSITYNLEVDDLDGGTFEPSFNVVITGTNDAPEIAAGATANISERTGLSGSTLTIDASGTIDFDDVDVADIGHVTAITAVTPTGDTAGLVSNTALETFLTLTTNTAANVVAGDIDWEFEAEDQVFDYLGEGESVTITYDLELDDLDGGTDTTTVAVTVVGANDAPEINVADSTITGTLDSLPQPTVISTAATDTPELVRAPIFQPDVFGSIAYPNQNVAGIAFDPVTGKVYESVGINRYGEAAIRVFADTASFEAGTVQTTITLGTALNGSSTDVHGTYFTAYDGVLIGKSGETAFEGQEEIAFWNASNGAVLSEITPIPGVLTVGSANYGFEWGGLTSINLLQDDSGIYALGKTTGTTWTLAELDPATQSVIGTESFNAGIQGFAFLVEGVIFFGNYQTGAINRAYNIETSTLSTVNISIGALGGTNDYWSNMSYDAATDTLYMVNSPSSPPALENGQIYKIENISDLVFEPQNLPTGTIEFDDLDLNDTHTVSITLPDAGPYLGTLNVGAVQSGSGTTSLIDWNYDIARADFDALAGGEVVTENFNIVIDDGGTGGTRTQTVTITIEGVNDAGTISGDILGALVEDDINNTASGDLDYTDIDGPDDQWLIATNSEITFGTYSIGSDGAWTFSLTNGLAEVNALDDGDLTSTSFTAETTDGTQQTITINITGANDAAIIAGTTAAGVVEDSATNFATGDLDHTDVDADDDDDIWQEITAASNTSSDEGFGTVEITTGGVWTYTLDNTNATVNALGQGDPVLEDTFTVLTEDGTSREILIQIAGANDRPIAADDTANFQLNEGMDVSDPAWTEFEGHFYQFIPANLPAGDFNWNEARADAILRGGHLANVTSAAENAFLLSLSGNDWGWIGGSDEAVEGEWRWVDGPEAGRQFWQGDDTGSATGGLYTNWETGQPNQSQENYIFIIDASNGGGWHDLDNTSANLGYYLEYSGLQAGGSVATPNADPDAGDTLTYQLNFDIDGLTMFEDGTWVFDLIDSTYDYLLNGEVLQVIAEYTVTDSFGAGDTGDLTLNITGIDNAPDITGDKTGSIGENTVGLATGNLGFTDPDNTDDIWQAEGPSVGGSRVASDNSYGTYAIDADGEWDYLVNGVNPTVNELDVGETLTDTFTVENAQGFEQIVSITINGANDAPMVVGESAAISLGIAEDPGAGWSLFEGHYYQYVSTPMLWAAAQADAETNGANLANITSQAENDFVDGLKGNVFAWIGGSDETTEGVWIWANGPEAGEQFWSGGGDGQSQDGRFTNWSAENPDNVGNEDFLSLFPDGTWNDSGPFSVGYIAEFSTLQVHTGSVAGNDTDPEGNNLTYSLAAPVDGVTMNADGDWTFDQTTTNAYDFIGATETVNVDVTYNVSDGSLTGQGVLQLAITGTNNAAVVTGDATGVVDENIPSDTATGNKGHTDIDGDNADDVWQVVTAGENASSDNGLGTYTVTSGGVWTFTLDDSNPTVNALDIGESIDEYFTIFAEDGTPTQVTITINGANDDPTATAATASVTLENVGLTSTVGWSEFDGNYYQFVAGSLGWAAASTDAATNGGHLATVTSAAENAHIHTLNGSAVGWLGATDAAVEGEWRWVDGPEAGQMFFEEGVGVASGFFANWAAGQPDGEDYLHSFGDLTWNDLDDNGQPNQEMGYFLEYSGNHASGTLTANGTDPEGDDLTFSLNAPVDGLTLFGNGDWIFDQDHSAYQSLAGGAMTDIVANYTVEDTNGGTDTASLTLTLTGVNDAAVITGTTTDSVAENAIGAAVGDLDSTDVDSTQADDDWQEQSVGTASDLGYGTFSINTMGQWTFLVDNANTTVNALNDGDDLTDTFTVQTVDGTEQVITVTINGANDAPEVQNESASFTLETVIDPGAGWSSFQGHYYRYVSDNTAFWDDARAAALSNGGYLVNITSSDEDLFIDSLKPVGVRAWIGANDAAVEGEWRWIDGPEAGQQFWQGGVSGTAVNGSYENWRVGEPNDFSVDEDYSFTNADGDWLDGVATQEFGIDGYIEEFGTLQVPTGTVAGNDSDPEGSALSYALDSSFAGLTMAADGSWVFDQTTTSAYDYLGASQSDLFNVNYTVTDADSASATGTLALTITGVNDAAVVSGVTSGTVDEDMGSDSVSGDAEHTDVDSNNNDDVWIVDGGSANYGTYSVTSAGVWDYTLDQNASALDALDSGQTLGDSFVITTQDGTTQTIDITINGADEAAPLVANDDSGFIEDINVLILGAPGATLTDAANQLNGSNDDRFNFNVSISTADIFRASVQWDALYSSVDVVVVGGGAFGVAPTADEAVAYAQLADNFLNDGLSVVTTGSIVQTLDAAIEQVATDLDTISPVSIPTSSSTTSAITITDSNHPITDDIDPNQNFGNTIWANSTVNSGSATQLANNGTPSVHTLSFIADSGTIGRSVFIGGKYLEGGFPTGTQDPLRDGDPDFLLEQAVAWAAGVDKVDVNENEPFMFTGESLLANDTGPVASATITSVQTFSDKGATILLSGGDIFYNPLTSQKIEQTLDGATETDTFTYTISDGTTTDTATVTVTISGITDLGDRPELPTNNEMAGFTTGAQTANAYRFGNRFSDVDEAGGMDYLLYDLATGNPVTSDPTGVGFSATFVDFTFSAAAQTNYNDDYGLYAYENDGQSVLTDFGYSVDSSGNLRFFYSEFDAVDEGPVLEVSPDWIGAGGNVDLTGVDSIEALAPDLLDNLAVLDIENGQNETLTLDTAALLELVRGNGTTAENITFKLDTGDTFIAEDDNIDPNSGWDAIETLSGSGIYNLYDTNTSDGFFSDVGGSAFATLYVDDGVASA